ncbi:hypothetical protein OG21DRAFT_1580901 [Imleria badia]|nr:hypothetical protein OG21DRAFT_1580901 [Imleria badia]
MAIDITVGTYAVTSPFSANGFGSSVRTARTDPVLSIVWGSERQVMGSQTRATRRRPDMLREERENVVAFKEEGEEGWVKARPRRIVGVGEGRVRWGGGEAALTSYHHWHSVGEEESARAHSCRVGGGGEEEGPGADENEGEGEAALTSSQVGGDESARARSLRVGGGEEEAAGDEGEGKAALTSSRRHRRVGEDESARARSRSVGGEEEKRWERRDLVIVALVIALEEEKGRAKAHCQHCLPCCVVVIVSSSLLHPALCLHMRASVKKWCWSLEPNHNLPYQATAPMKCVQTHQAGAQAGPCLGFKGRAGSGSGHH